MQILYKRATVSFYFVRILLTSSYWTFCPSFSTVKGKFLSSPILKKYVAFVFGLEIFCLIKHMDQKYNKPAGKLISRVT